MRPPLFSVLIPVIKSSFLTTAIESVLKQSYQNWELVIYNDHSPDAIDEIVEAHNDSRIRYFKGEKNLGKEDPSKTWNTILPFAQGQYVCLLGDDDYISENYLEEIQKLILKYPHVDIFRTALKRVDEKNIVILADDPLPEHESWEESLYQRNVKNRQQSTSEFVLRKSRLLDIGGYASFPLAWGSDDMTYLLMAKKNGIASTNKAYAYWRKSAWNISDNGGQRLSEQERTLFLLRERDFLDIMFPSHIPAHTLYKSIDVKLTETEVRKYWHERMEIEAELQNIRGREEKIQSQVHMLQQELDRVKQEAVNAERRVEDSDVLLQEAYEIQSRLKIQEELLQNNLLDKENHIATLYQRISRYEEQIHILNQDLDENKKIIEQEQIHAQKLQENFSIELEQRKELDTTLENYQKTIQELTLRTESLQNEWNIASQKATDLDTRIQDIVSELEQTKNTVFSKNQELEQIYLSREWKIIEHIRKVISIVIPKGSIRRATIELLWELFKRPFRFFRQIKTLLKGRPLLKKSVFERSFKKQENNLQSNKIVFIGHSYHNKTKSSAFFVEYLKQFYEVEVILDESWLGKPFADLSFVDDTYAGVIFWQNLPAPEVLENTKNSNVVFFPMYDSVGGFGRDFWEKYKGIKIVSFSKTIHDRLREWGFRSLYIQYFPPPKEFTPGNKKEVFFWQRLTKLNINTVKRLVGKEKVSIHIHTAVDPGYEFIKPTKDDEKKFNIRYSDWLNKKSELISLIKEKGVYIAPREFEGIGLSFLEAMAMGKAVIAVNNPTMNEYIVHNQTGYLYDLSKPASIDLSHVEEIQKNTYDFMCQGYRKWEREKSKIIDFIMRQ